MRPAADLPRHSSPAASPALSLIVAMSENGVIGREGALPWRLPRDLQHFKSITLGKPVLMGRRTFESIGRPLTGRTNIVLTRDGGFRAAGVIAVPNFERALKAAGDAPEVMVIGGASLYREALPLAGRIYLTRVHVVIEGDTHFPPIDLSAWCEVEQERHAADDRHAHAMTFSVLERR